MLWKQLSKISKQLKTLSKMSPDPSAVLVPDCWNNWFILMGSICFIYVYIWKFCFSFSSTDAYMWLQLSLRALKLNSSTNCSKTWSVHSSQVLVSCTTARQQCVSGCYVTAVEPKSPSLHSWLIHTQTACTQTRREGNRYWRIKKRTNL